MVLDFLQRTSLFPPHFLLASCDFECSIRSGRRSRQLAINATVPDSQWTINSLETALAVEHLILSTSSSFSSLLLSDLRSDQEREREGKSTNKFKWEIRFVFECAHLPSEWFFISIWRDEYVVSPLATLRMKMNAQTTAIAKTSNDIKWQRDETERKERNRNDEIKQKIAITFSMLFYCIWHRLRSSGQRFTCRIAVGMGRHLAHSSPQRRIIQSNPIRYKQRIKIYRQFNVNRGH